MLEDAGGSPDVIQQATEQSHGLGIFIRSLVGLDRETAKQAFSQFVIGTTVTASQLEFIDLIVQPEALFLPIRVTEMVRVLDEIRQRATA